jgi:hypothetical protein
MYGFGKNAKTYKSKYIKYLHKMIGGYMCGICKNQGSTEIELPNELNECKSCGYIVCSNCLQQVNHRCPQERENKSWNIIDRTNPNYENDTETTKSQIELTDEQKKDLGRETEKARQAEKELRERAANSELRQSQLPIVNDPLNDFYDNDEDEDDEDDDDGEYSNYEDEDDDDEFGFNRYGIHRDTGRRYDINGFNRDGIHRDTREVYNSDNFNRYEIHGYTGRRYNYNGYDINGIDSNLFDIRGIHRDTHTQYNRDGFDIYGIHRDTHIEYNNNGFNINRMHRYTRTRYNRDGFDINGFNRDGIHRDTGTEYDINGFNRDGRRRNDLYND